MPRARPVDSSYVLLERTVGGRWPQPSGPKRRRETALLASTYARKRHSRPLANLLRPPPPPRRNGSELQRSAPREFAQQKLHEEQQPAEADAASASKRRMYRRFSCVGGGGLRALAADWESRFGALVDANRRALMSVKPKSLPTRFGGSERIRRCVKYPNLPRLLAARYTGNRRFSRTPVLLPICGR